MCFRILGIILVFIFSFLTSQAQWKFHQASVFGGDTVYQPIFSLKNANEGFCVAGRNAMAEGKNRKNALYVTTNGGLNWTRILDGENTVMGLGSLGEDTIIVSLGGHLMRSFDGMQTWDTVWNEGGFINAFKDDNLFYYVIPGKGTFKSNDLGVSLTKVSDKGWYWVNPRIGYTLNSTPMEILKTQDSGKTWVKCSSPDPGLTPLNGVFSFPSEKVIYAKVRDKMYRSDDAGDSWKVLQTFSRSVNINTEGIYFINAKDGFHAFGGEFFKTNDSGRTWCLQPPSLIGSDVISQNTFVMHFENDSLGIWANGGGATGMTTMTTTNQGGPPCPSDTTIKGLGAELGFNQLKVFPNPSTGLLTLALEQGQLSHVQLFSMEGRLVFTQKLSEQEVTLQLPAMSPGIYMLEVQSTANKVFRQKLVIE